MKKVLILCSILLLAACIDVDDYGDYWDKTTIDPSLEGRWVKLSEEDDGKTTGQEWTFTIKDGAYQVQSFTNGKPSDDAPLYPVKTITAGSYKFLASGPEKGTIVRYDIAGNAAVWYVADPQTTWDFIQQNYPDQMSIYRDDPDEGDSPEDVRNRPLKINLFNDEVVKILSAIPNTGTYWDPDTKTKKIQ